MMCPKCSQAGDLQSRVAAHVEAFLILRRAAGASSAPPFNLTEDAARLLALRVHHGTIESIPSLHLECTGPGCTCQHVLPEWVTSGTLPS